MILRPILAWKIGFLNASCSPCFKIVWNLPCHFWILDAFENHGNIEMYKRNSYRNMWVSNSRNLTRVSHLDLRVFMADQIEICEKLIPLMLPNVNIFRINIMVVKAADKFFATLKWELDNTPSSFGIKTFHPRGAKFLIFHAEPLKNTDASSHSVVVNKTEFFLLICQLKLIKNVNYNLDLAICSHAFSLQY